MDKAHLFKFIENVSMMIYLTSFFWIKIKTYMWEMIWYVFIFYLFVVNFICQMSIKSTLSPDTSLYHECPGCWINHFELHIHINIEAYHVFSSEHSQQIVRSFSVNAHGGVFVSSTLFPIQHCHIYELQLKFSYIGCCSYMNSLWWYKHMTM